MHPPFDPELQEVLVTLEGEMATTSMTTELIPRMREAVDALTPSISQLLSDGTVVVEEFVAEDDSGSQSIPMLVCRPVGRAGLSPGVIYFHPGGMISGSNRTGLDGLLSWVLSAGVIVASVGYRLAPEHPDPTPVLDGFAALKWVFANGTNLGIDTNRVVSIGISAGGGIAAGVSLMARDESGPEIAGQMLIGPMLDDRQKTQSSGELEGEGTWDRISNTTAWASLLGQRAGSEDVSQYAAPARASDLRGLPPTFLDVGSVETFRDETIEFANRIWHAAGNAELHVWQGAFHGFDEAAPGAALSRTARSTRTAWLIRRLGVE